MRGLWMVALAASFVGATPALALIQQKGPGPLPAEIVAAWEKAGAKVGWLGSNEVGYLEFRSNMGDRKDQELPAVEFKVWQTGAVDGLPQPACDFGLSLCYTALPDAGLKEIAKLKSLRSLDVGCTGVTDAGLKDLAALQFLQCLSLKGTEVTETGLKELASLKSLRTLDLSSTQITDGGLKQWPGCHLSGR